MSVPRPSSRVRLAEVAPFLGLGAWLVLGLTASVAAANIPGDHVLCLFRRLTNLPCPACGGTRAAERLLNADLAGAFAMNPMVTAVLLMTLAMMAWLAAGNPRRKWRGLLACIPGNRSAVAAFVLGVGANWIYVLSTQA